MSALNKLSIRNYARIHRAMTLMISSGALGCREVIDAIFAKSTTDEAYALMYAGLLDDLYSNPATGGATEEGTYAESLVTVLDEAYDGLLNRVLSVADAWRDVPATCDASMSSYDRFCAAVKAKKLLLGQHVTCMALVGTMDRRLPGWSLRALKRPPLQAIQGVVRGAANVEGGGGSAAAVMLALELALQYVDAATPTRAHKKQLRDVIRATLPEDRIAVMGSHGRFKYADVLSPTRVAPAAHRALALQLASVRVVSTK